MMDSHNRKHLSRKRSPFYITISSDESVDENNLVAIDNDNKIIDPFTVTTIKKFIEYIPQTINTHNQNRLSILPKFPSSTNDNKNSNLLLVNVPEECLSIEQLTLRQKYQSKKTNELLPHLFNKNDHLILSSLQNYFEVNYQFFVDLFHINWHILDYNYAHLDDCLQRFANERIYRLQQTPYEVRLLDEEKLIAMEIFLQIDVDLFYWKTFSNRHRQLTGIDTNEYGTISNLFCKYDPEIRFSMVSCRDSNCRVCASTINDSTHRPYSSINFQSNGMYKFLNGYKTILNYPVTCNTNGIIYVLKCPCGQCEYVGESSNNILYTLDRHRSNGNYVMHEFLIGQYKATHNSNSYNINQKRHMRLYQHSPRCTIVMQMFLNCYPHYWIFVPMSINMAQKENIDYIKWKRTTPIITSNLHNVITSAIRTDRDIDLCLQNIPLPPPSYQFSQQQRDAQRDFFRYKKDQQLPHLPLDLYDASIILTLPTKTSPVLRQFIASLFITHGETNLNSIGNLLENTKTNPLLSSETLRGNWCYNLKNRPSLTKS